MQNNYNQNEDQMSEAEEHVLSLLKVIKYATQKTEEELGNMNYDLTNSLELLTKILEKYFKSNRN